VGHSARRQGYYDRAMEGEAVEERVNKEARIATLYGTVNLLPIATPSKELRLLG